MVERVFQQPDSNIRYAVRHVEPLFERLFPNRNPGIIAGAIRQVTRSIPMQRKVVKVRAGDTEFDAIEQQFEIGREDWNEYRLLDGGSVRVKTTVQRIFRVVDSEGNPVYDTSGDPHMIVRHKSDVVAVE